MAKGNLNGWVFGEGQAAVLVQSFQVGFLGSPFPVQRQNLGTWAVLILPLGGPNFAFGQETKGPAAASLSPDVWQPQLPDRVILQGSFSLQFVCELPWLALCVVVQEGGGELTWGPLLGHLLPAGLGKQWLQALWLGERVLLQPEWRSMPQLKTERRKSPEQ